MSNKWKLIDNSDECAYRHIRDVFSPVECMHDFMPNTKIGGIELPYCVEKYCPLKWHTVDESE